MPSCKDVARATATGESPTGWIARSLRRLHLLVCRNCHEYSRQLEGISAAARASERDPAEQSIDAVRAAVLAQLRDAVDSSADDDPEHDASGSV